VFSCEPITHTRAFVTSFSIFTFGAIHTRFVHHTLVHIFTAVLSFIISRTFAVIATDSINTGASVLARLVYSTLVHICFTVSSSIFRITRTLVASWDVGTRSSILTWTADGTFIDIFVTILSLVTWFTLTIVAVTLRFTYSTIFARVLGFTHVVSLITAVPQIACWWLLQLVHVMTTTVSHFDHDTPSAAVVAPVEANLSVDHSVLLLGMIALHPSRSVGTATLSGDTGVGYLGAGISDKLMPFSDCW